MKTKAILLLLAAMAAGVSYLDIRAQTPASSSGTKVSYPYGNDCIVTIDPRADRKLPLSTTTDSSGFQQDGTLRGTLIYLSEEWCILKDGTFENWIPRDKVLTMRVSK